MNLDSIKGRVAPCPGIADHVITDRGVIYRVVGTDLIEMTLNGSRGYLYYKEKPVAHMVLMAFVGPKPDDNSEACHFPDPDTFNNHYMNLVWGSRSDNARHASIIQKCKEDWRIWCCCESDPTLRCPVHPWVCVDPIGNGPTPAFTPAEPKRPGRKMEGISLPPIDATLRKAVTAFYLSEHKPTMKEVAEKYDISATTVGRILSGEGIKSGRPGRRTTRSNIHVTEDLKADMVAHYRESKNYTTTAKLFGVAAASVQRYVNAADLIESNTVADSDILAFHKGSAQPDINKTAKHFGVSPVTVYRIIQADAQKEVQ